MIVIDLTIKKKKNEFLNNNKIYHMLLKSHKRRTHGLSYPSFYSSSSILTFDRKG